MTLFTRRKKDEEDVPALNKVVQAEQAVQNAEAKRDKAVMNYALKNPVSPVIPKLNPVEEIHRQREQQRLTEAYNQRQASKEIPVLSIPKTNAIPETKRSQPHTDRISPVPKNTNPAPVPLQRLAQAEPESTFIQGGQEPRNTSGSFLREVERQQHQNVRDSFGNTAADYNGPNSASLWQEMRPRYVAGSQARYKGERVEMDNAANSRLFNYAQKAAGSEPFTQEELKDFQNLAYTVASDFEEKIKNQTVTPADIDLLNYVDGIYTSALTTKTLENERPEGGYDVQEYTTPAFGTGEAYRNAFASQALNLPRMLTDALIKDPDYQGWREANDARRAELAAAHPYATMAGQATGTALTYALANAGAADAGLTDQIASRLAIQNPALASSVANLMVGQGVDTVLDTIPTEYMNYKNGMRGWELVNDTLKNQAINGLINIGAELPGLIGGLKNVDAAKQAQDALNAQNIRRFAPALTDEGKVASGIVNGVQVGDLTGGEVRSLTDSLADAAKIPVLDEGKITSGVVNGINVSDVTGGEVKDLVDPALVDNRIGRVMTSIQNAPTIDRPMLDALGDLDKALANSENVPEAAEKLGKVLRKNRINYDAAALDDIIKAYGGEPKSYLPGITDAMEEQYPEQIAKIRSDMANYQTAMEAHGNGEISAAELYGYSKEVQADYDKLARATNNPALKKTGYQASYQPFMEGVGGRDAAREAVANYKAGNLEISHEITPEEMDVINGWIDYDAAKGQAERAARESRIGGRTMAEDIGLESDTLTRPMPANIESGGIPNTARGEYESAYDVFLRENGLTADEHARQVLGDEEWERLQKQVREAESYTKEGMPPGYDSDADWDELVKSAEESPTEKMIREARENAPEGQKLSRTYSTIQNAENLTDEQKAFRQDPKDFYYTPGDEDEMAAAAKASVANDREGLYESYMNTKGQKRSAQDAHNMWEASESYRQDYMDAVKRGDEMAAQELKNRSERLFKQYRESGTESAQYLRAMKEKARTAEGAIFKAEDALEQGAEQWGKGNPKAKDGIDKLAQMISDFMHDHNGAEIMNGTDEGLKDSLRADLNDAVVNYLEKNADAQTRKALKGLTQNTVNKVMLDGTPEDIARHLDFFASSGGLGVRVETMDRVVDLFEEAKQFNYNSKDYVQRELEAYALLANDIAKEGSFKDKFDQWRYFAMLANPTTHLKNMTGNLLFDGVTSVKNDMAAVIESAADRVSRVMGGEGIERTKAILNPVKDQDLLKACYDDAMNNAYRDLSGNKYFDVGRGIDQAIPTWNNDTLHGRVLNKLTGMNTKALNVEDEVAMTQKYATSLAGYLKANGLDESVLKSTDPQITEVVESARQYAIEQAKEAAFHQENKVAEHFSQFVRGLRESDRADARALGLMLDVTMPFKKTPANILVSAVEYSPAKYATVVKDIVGVNKGTVKAAKLIDDLSKATTGTGMLAIGAVLAHQGILQIGSDKGERETAFDKQTGRQNAAIKLGKTYINVAEMVPAAAPLIFGATAYETLRARNGDESALNIFANGMAAITDQMTDMTMLSGISNTLSSMRYAENGTEQFLNLGGNVAGNLASQMLPTIGRKTEVSIDPTQRTTYSDKTGLQGSMERNAKYLTTKIPGSQAIGEALEGSGLPILGQVGDLLTREPSINIWGQQVPAAGGDNFASRLAYNMLSPAKVTTDKNDPLNNAISELAASMGDDTIIPYYTSSEAKFKRYDDDGNIVETKLNEKDWTRYQELRGQTLRGMDELLMFGDKYASYTPEEKAAALKNVEAFAKTYARSGFNGKMNDKDAELVDIYNSEGPEAALDKMLQGNTISSLGGRDDAKHNAIYEQYGEEGLTAYIDAHAVLGSSPTIQETLDYMNSNPNAPDQIPTLVSNVGGTYYRDESGSWQYERKKKDTAAQANAAEPVPVLTVSQQKKYDQYIAIPGLENTTAEDYLKLKDDINTDGGNLSKAELITFLDNSSYDQDTKRLLYDALRGGSNWPNPY